jgi:hypothetical protein
VPLIAKAVADAGVPAAGLEGLTALIEGRIDVEEWLARVRRAERERVGEDAEDAEVSAA